MSAKRRFILTGAPGIGKTTAIVSACDRLKRIGATVRGFYTEEVRKNGRRVGFDVVDLDGGRAALARSDGSVDSKRTLGNYSVLVDEFETIAVPTLSNAVLSINDVLVIDEIGKMEMFSDKFIESIKRVFKSTNCIVLATIPIAKGKPIPLVESIRRDINNKIITVDVTNRDELPGYLTNEIIKLL